MGSNLIIYILEEYVKDYFLLGLTDDSVKVDEKIVFDKESDLNMQMSDVTGKILLSDIEYNGEKFREDDYGNPLLYMKVKDFKDYNIKPSFKQNEELMNEKINSLDDDRCIVLGYG